MKHKTTIIILVLILSVFFLIHPAFAKMKKKGVMWVDEESGAVAIDPTELGGTVTDSLEIAIEGIAFEYTNISDFVLVPNDGKPSMVLIFNKGSTESTLYIDNDAKELLDSKKNKIEIIGASSLKVKKSDLKKAPETEIYEIEVKDNNGKKNLKNAIDNELVTGSKVIYPQISGPSTNAKGSTVIIKKSEDIGLFDIKSINDFMLWINLKFDMNLKNEEKLILQDGIFATLEKAVEDNTASIPGESTESEQVISENTCVAI
ncbi:MAG: hypothetical protein DRN71_01755 [Candidatus Nanohalarchaeota archaeon]|nr:MAG: hypothetical protein DRN71_01755 [Candidatus Nanohaloarchaeota archaeon]